MNEILTAEDVVLVSRRDWRREIQLLVSVSVFSYRLEIANYQSLISNPNRKKPQRTWPNMAGQRRIDDLLTDRGGDAFFS